MSEERVAPASVVIKDIDIPFGSMVVLVFKWTMATIPTAILLFLAGTILAGIVRLASERSAESSSYASSGSAYPYKTPSSSNAPIPSSAAIPYPAQDDPRAKRLLRSCKDGKTYALDGSSWVPYSIGGTPMPCTVEPPAKE